MNELDAQCKTSLLLFAQTMAIDAEACYGAFRMQIGTCECWYCTEVRTLFAGLPKYVPEEILRFYSWRNYFHFCLYPKANCDLN